MCAIPHKFAENRIVWILWSALWMRACGLGIRYLWSSYETESPLFETLLFDRNWPTHIALGCEDLLLWLNLAAVMVTGWLLTRSPTRVTWWLLSFCTLFEVGLASLTWYRGGIFMSNWIVMTHALRFGLPIAVLLADGERWEPSRTPSSRHRSAGGPLSQGRNYLEPWLRMTTAAVFFSHGIVALCKDPGFVTLLVGSAENLFGGHLSQAIAERLLIVIGLIDCVLAIALLVGKWWTVAFYMAVWGLITALSRITAGGWQESHEALLRAGHFAAPLALYLTWHKRG